MQTQTPPLHLIQSFLAFADAKNMQEAARQLGLSQPALTNHLKLFETFFPQDVFGQDGRKKVLTRFGQDLRDVLAQRFRNLGEDIKHLNDRYQKPEGITVRIGGRLEILNMIAPKLKFPGTLIFHGADGASAAQGVFERKYELAISNHASKFDSLYAKKVFSDQFTLLAPKSWLQGKTSRLSTALSTLLEKPYLAYKETDPALEALLRHENSSIAPAQHRVLQNWPSLIAMVEAKTGWTVAPARYGHGEDTISIPVPTSVYPETEFFVLYRRDTKDLPWLRALIEEVRESF